MHKPSIYDDSMTLGEAIQKLRALEAERDMTNNLSADVTHALEQHDAIHILFNCGTSMQDEIAAHVWMLFATTANISEMHRVVASQQHRTVLTDIGHFQLLSVWLTMLPRIIKIIFQSLRMNKRLAVEELVQLRGQPIAEIRQECGIRV
jgi:ubiquinone biosynthesis protein Coq4